MGYYRGDHYRRWGTIYRGDYYRGDPGFLSGLGRALKVVGGAALGFITGGPKGAITGAVTGTVGAVTSGIKSETLAAGGTESAYTPELAAAHAAAVARGPVPTIVAPPGVAMVGPMMPGGGMMVLRGYRWNKSTYVTRGGGTSRWMPGIQIHPKMSVQVKTRRMNVGNARALRRAIRRARGFAKLAARVMSSTKRFKGGKKK